MEFEDIKHLNLVDQLKVLRESILSNKITEEEVEDILFEMSFNKAFVVNKIVNQSENINTHLICLLLYPKEQEANHWKKEIKAFITNFSIYKIKPKNEYLSQNQYLFLLFEYIENDTILLEKIIKNVKRKEKKLKPINILNQAVYDKMFKFHKKLSEELSLGKVTNNSIEKLLQELIS